MTESGTMFNLPSNVIAAIFIALAMTFCTIGLFAWYLRRRYGTRPRISERVVSPRKSRRKSGKGRK